MNNVYIGIVVSITLGTGLIVGMFIGRDLESTKWQIAAAKTSCGEFSPQSGEFRWVDNKKPERFGNDATIKRDVTKYITDVETIDIDDPLYQEKIDTLRINAKVARVDLDVARARIDVAKFERDKAIYDRDKAITQAKREVRLTREAVASGFKMGVNAAVLESIRELERTRMKGFDSDNVIENTMSDFMKRAKMTGPNMDKGGK